MLTILSFYLIPRIGFRLSVSHQYCVIMSTLSANSETAVCTICKPPARPPICGKSVYLAGSINMGSATDWQAKVTSSLSHLPITFFNPSRDDWCKDWMQEISNPQFREYVKWELNYLDCADIITMFFNKNSISPVSLLELSLYTLSYKIVVYCPEGYWRCGNI